MRSLLGTMVFITSTVLMSAASMDTLYRWKYIDYVWESEARRQEAINTGEYNYTRVVPMDVDKAPDGRVFITMDGRKGSPAHLATVSDQMGPSGPLLKPYPDWSYHKSGDCNSMQNVLRIAIDECERLWVLDAGYKMDQPMVCEPQLLAFDLKTDRLIRRIKIPHHLAKGRNGQTLLAAPIVETRGRWCRDTTVYMADTEGYGLLIWNNGYLSRLEHPVFEPVKAAENFTSGDYTIHWPSDGIVTMALSPPTRHRFLYFHSLTSFDLHAASTYELKHSAYHGSYVHYDNANNALRSQAVGMAFSAEGILFVGLTKESSIVCWDWNKPLRPDTVGTVAQDNDRLQYVNAIKIIRQAWSREEEIWAIDNRFVAFLLNKLDFNEYNYHVFKGSVSKVIANTVCTTKKIS